MHAMGLLLIGTIAGAAAGRVMGHRTGLFRDMLVGLAGSLAGGWLFGLLGIYTQGSAGFFVTAFVGAFALLSALDFLHLKSG